MDRDGVARQGSVSPHQSSAPPRRLRRVTAGVAGVHWASVKCLGQHDDRPHRMRLPTGQLMVIPICHACGRVNRHAQREVLDVDADGRVA